MFHWLKSLLQARESPINFEKKASVFSSLMACGSLGRALWTPAQYDRLSEEGYQKNVIVYRSVNLIARSIASVPWLLYDGEEEVDQHPLLNLLNKPNPPARRQYFDGVDHFLPAAVGKHLP